MVVFNFIWGFNKEKIIPIRYICSGIIILYLFVCIVYKEKKTVVNCTIEINLNKEFTVPEKKLLIFY